MNMKMKGTDSAESCCDQFLSSGFLMYCLVLLALKLNPYVGGVAKERKGDSESHRIIHDWDDIWRPEKDEIQTATLSSQDNDQLHRQQAASACDSLHLFSLKSKCFFGAQHSYRVGQYFHGWKQNRLSVHGKILSFAYKVGHKKSTTYKAHILVKTWLIF